VRSARCACIFLAPALSLHRHNGECSGAQLTGGRVYAWMQTVGTSMTITRAAFGEARPRAFTARERPSWVDGFHSCASAALSLTQYPWRPRIKRRSGSLGFFQEHTETPGLAPRTWFDSVQEGQPRNSATYINTLLSRVPPGLGPSPGRDRSGHDTWVWHSADVEICIAHHLHLKGAGR